MSEPYQPIVVAHRGLWFWYFPENSIEAFAAAAGAGFPAECDVWPSADGVPFVIHDETLDRATTGRGKVSACTSGELQDVRLRHPHLRSCRLPTLSEAADLVTYVEVKPANAAAFVRSVIKVMGGRGWLLQSFNATNLEHAAGMDRSVPLALLAEDSRGVEVALDGGWPVHVDHRLLDDRTVGRLRDRGLRVGAWTVNTKDEIRRVLAWRPDVIISDQPHLVRHILRTSGVRR